MDTSEAPSPIPKSEDSQMDSEKSQTQCDSSSQSESQTKSESQTQTNTSAKEMMEKPVKFHFRAPLKVLYTISLSTPCPYLLVTEAKQLINTVICN